MEIKNKPRLCTPDTLYHRLKRRKSWVGIGQALLDIYTLLWVWHEEWKEDKGK